VNREPRNKKLRFFYISSFFFSFFIFSFRALRPRQKPRRRGQTPKPQNQDTSRAIGDRYPEREKREGKKKWEKEEGEKVFLFFEKNGWRV